MDTISSSPNVEGRSLATTRDALASVLREHLDREGSIEMEAIGSSMEPTVPGGSLLRIERLTSSPVVDELVAFVPDGGALFVCHRVVAVDDRGQVLTQGDRHPRPDGFSAPGRIVGVVRAFTLGGRLYAVGPALSRPRPSAYRVQRQRVVRLIRRLRAR
jgi:hypothetical protein